MKSYWLIDLIFLSLVAGIGFIFPWWSVFVICFLWSYFKIAKASKIMISVFVTYLIMILVFGNRLLKVVDFNFGKMESNYLIAVGVSLLFSIACALIASLATHAQVNKQ